MSRKRKDMQRQLTILCPCFTVVEEYLPVYDILKIIHDYRVVYDYSRVANWIFWNDRPLLDGTITCLFNVNKRLLVHWKHVSTQEVRTALTDCIVDCTAVDDVVSCLTHADEVCAKLFPTSPCDQQKCKETLTKLGHDCERNMCKMS